MMNGRLYLGSTFKSFSPISYHWIAPYDASYLLLSHAVYLTIALQWCTHREFNVLARRTSSFLENALPNLSSDVKTPKLLGRRTAESPRDSGKATQHEATG